MSLKADHSSACSAYEQERLRHLQYAQLQQRIGHLFTTTTNFSGGSQVYGVNHLQFLWQRFGGHPKWQELLSPDQLSLLLSFDERSIFRCDGDALMRPGFVECVLSRLPRLTTCVLTNVEFTCCHAELFAAPLLCDNPFPALHHLDLRRSTVHDAELVALVRIMPHLETCDARGCSNVTWRGLEEARQVAGAMGHPALQIQPASEAEKDAEHDWLFALYGHHLNKGDGGILALCRELGTKEQGSAFDLKLSDAQLNMLLSHDTRETFRIESVLESKKHLPSFLLETMLSRLPKLKVLTIRSMHISTRCSMLLAVPNPFPSLRELYFDMTDVVNRDIEDLVKLLPHLEVLGLKGCYQVTWRVMELARATCGPRLRVLPESYEEKKDADAVVLDTLWSDPETAEAKEEYMRLVREFYTTLQKMKTEKSRNGPWMLWKELGGMHCWRTYLRPTQLTLILSHDETTEISFSVDTQDRSSGAPSAGPATAPVSVVGTSVSISATTATSSLSAATDANSWSVVTDPASTGSNALAFDAGEVRAYFSHVLARLPALKELNLDGCPVWPFVWKLEDDRISTPFHRLRCVRLRNMTCHAKDLRDLVRHVPSLEKGEEDSANNGILVDAAYVLYDDYSGSKLRQMCCGKVSVCHVDGTWHPLGDKM